MNKLFVGFIALTMAVVAVAQDSTPYPPAIKQKFDYYEAQPAFAPITTDGTVMARWARVTYDVATDGGTGAIGLGVYLPAKSLIKRTIYRVQQQFTDSGAGTVAVSCEDAGNIIAAADITGLAAGTIGAGVATGSAATMIDDIAAECQITATVTGATQTAGKLNIFVEYLVHD